MAAFIIIHGNPIDGYGFVGPFSDEDVDAAHEKAVMTAENIEINWGSGDWWVAPIQSPEEAEIDNTEGFKRFTDFLRTGRS